MANEHLKLEPHMIVDDECWWYECKSGLAVIVRHTNERTEEYRIPWRQIRAALERKDREANQ